MKKVLIIPGIILILSHFSYTIICAQNDLSAGGGLAWGSEVEAVGIQGGAKYGFTDKISGAADFIIFFPDNFDWFEFNANVHYGFFEQNNIHVYGLGGINFVSISNGFRDSDEVGLNLGSGVEFGLNFAKLYTELRFVISDADQVVLSSGLRFPL